MVGLGRIPESAAKNGLPRSIISSTFELDTGTGEVSLSFRSSLSRVSLSLDVAVVGEEDELEEDVEQCLSCLEGVTDVEEGSLRSTRSTCELDTGAGWESIPLRSSRARVSLSLDTVMVGEVDELEEDVG